MNLAFEVSLFIFRSDILHAVKFYDVRLAELIPLWRKACCGFLTPWLYILCNIFNDALDYIASDDRVINEWWFVKDLEVGGRGLSFKLLSSIRLEERKDNTKILSQDNRSPGRDLNPVPPEYEAEVLITRPRRSVYVYRVLLDLC
jgi:hypothetical protein